MTLFEISNCDQVTLKDLTISAPGAAQLENEINLVASSIATNLIGVYRDFVLFLNRFQRS